MGKSTIKIHILILIFSLVANFGCATIYQQQKKKMNENYQEGIQLYKKGDYKQAKERFETVLSIDPEHSGARQYLIITTEALQKRAQKYYDAGMNYKRKGDLENALLQFLEAEKRDPNYKDVKSQITSIRNSNYAKKKYDYHFTTAKKQFDKKQYIAAYQSTLNAGLYNPESLELAALKTRIKNQLENASYPYTSKALDARKKNKFEEAKTYCNKALKVNPWDEKAKDILKEIYRMETINEMYVNGEKAYTKGDLITAYRLFKRVDNEEPGYRNTTSYLSVIKSKLEANINTYYQNGITYYEQDNFEAAIAEWDKVLLVDPEHQKAREYRERAVAKLELQKTLR
ncbi:MAG: tetratricopeptide repeat protein [Spirochaetes bacterium]|nr:tetratricopeptide repeat protein [Spirochaetota bacterium]